MCHKKKAVCTPHPVKSAVKDEPSYEKQAKWAQGPGLCGAGLGKSYMGNPFGLTASEPREDYEKRYKLLKNMIQVAFCFTEELENIEAGYKERLGVLNEQFHQGLQDCERTAEEG